MKRVLIPFIVLVLLTPACNLPGSSADTPESATQPPPLPPDQGSPCGDGVCQGPENTQNCPVDCADTASSGTSTDRPVPAGGTLKTYVPSDGIGDIAVQVSLPETPRYPDGAGVVVEIATFFTTGRDYYSSVDVTAIGLMHVSYLWPGQSARSGEQSDGVFDYGGEIAVQALRDVIRFAAGQIPDRDGYYLEDLIVIQPLSDQVGLYAFSHPGLAAVNVMALYGDQIPEVGYLVGRENPTLDTFSSVELGHFDKQHRPILNPLYSYPAGYTPTEISLDYSSIRWDADYTEAKSQYVGRPYFDLNNNGLRDESDYTLDFRVPSMYDKRVYSTALTQALMDNGALSAANWPPDLSTPLEAANLWPFRTSVHRYPDLAVKTPDLKVMLVFALRQHVQPQPDKPNIHQAYDGFHHGANLWVRMNPDSAYLTWLNSDLGAASPEHAANTEPADWMSIDEWAYPNQAGSNILAPLAAVAEMADRLHENNWSVDLEQVLVDSPPPNLTP